MRFLRGQPGTKGCVDGSGNTRAHSYRSLPSCQPKPFVRHGAVRRVTESRRLPRRRRQRMLGRWIWNGRNATRRVEIRREEPVDMKPKLRGNLRRTTEGNALWPSQGGDTGPVHVVELLEVLHRALWTSFSYRKHCKDEGVETIWIGEKVAIDNGFPQLKRFEGGRGRTSRAAWERISFLSRPLKPCIVFRTRRRPEKLACPSKGGKLLKDNEIRLGDPSQSTTGTVLRGEQGMYRWSQNRRSASRSHLASIRAASYG